MVCTRGQLKREEEDAAAEAIAHYSPFKASRPQVEPEQETGGLQERSVNTLPMPGLEDKPATAPAQPAPASKKLTGDDRPLKRLPDTIQATNKLPDGPEPIAVEIEYPSRQELNRVDGEGGQVLAGLPASLASPDWVEVCRTLGVLRQLAVHEQPALLEPHLAELVPPVLKSVRSLRSSTAILAVGDLYLSLADALLPYTDVGGAGAPTTSMLCSLLLKAASSEKQFVVSEAQRSLELMAESLDPSELASLLLPYTEHKNPKVRGRAAIVLELTQGRLQASGKEGSDPATLLATSGRLLTDNTPEAREAAKKLLVHVKAAFSARSGPEPVPVLGDGEEAPPTAWETFCKAHLPGSAAIAVLKAQQ